MPDGRKIPYLIELGFTDAKLKQQMSKWDWEGIMGTKGKGFGDLLVNDAQAAKSKLEHTFNGLNIDWSKILGKKELAQLEQVATKVLAGYRKDLEKIAISGDTTGLQKTIDLVSELGNELKGLGSNFDAASLARGMGAFIKILTPLTAKFEALANEPKKIEAAFDRLFSGVSASAKSMDLGKAFEVSGKIKLAMNGLKATNDEIKDATESLEKYRNVVSKLSGDNPATIKLAQDLDGLNQQLDEQMRKEEQLAAQNKTNSVQYAATLKNIMAIENARLKMKAKPATDYAGVEISQDFGYYEEKINKVIERASNKISELEGKLADTVDKSFAEVISKQISDIKINLSLTDDSKTNLVNKINQYVSEINKAPLEKIKIQIDDVANVIENRSTRGYGGNKGDDDANTTKLIAQTEKRFKGIRGAMYRNQNKILQQTKEWRQQMLEQFKFKSGDFEFNFNNNLVEELQSLFDEYGLKINIDPTYLADQIKTVLEGSNVSLSGGIANIDQASMTAAIMTGVREALLGEQVLTTTTTTSSQERISDVTDEAATEIEKTAKHLDIAEEYVQDVVQKLKDVAKYATKHLGTDKDTKGAIATREQFKSFGIDLAKVQSVGDDDVQIAEMLNPLLKRGDFNQLIGSTVIDELSAFKGSSSNTISTFVNSLREVFYMLQEDTETVDEWTRKTNSREIFDYARGRAKAASSLRDVRSSVRTDKIPDIEYIDKAIAAMSAIGKNTDSLESLRLAREKLGSKTDEQSIQEFNAVANDFYKSTTKVFYDIKKQAEDAFKGTVYLQGSKKGVVKKQDIESYKQLARIGDDDVILDIRVTSSLNNVSLGTTKSKYKDRISPYEEKRLLDGKRGDYTVSPEYEKDILRRELEYGGFKPQGAPTTDVNLDTTLEANTKKREALMAEIKANEEEKKLLREQIENADRQIANLTAKNDAIPQGRKNATQKKIAEREALSTKLADEIFWLEERVGNGKDGNDKRVGSLTKEIEEQQSRRVSAERQLAELSELDVERRKKSLTNKIAEIESKDIPGLQQDLEKAQIKYRTAESERVIAQVEVLKAQSALKDVPKGKANDAARAEATERVGKANRELAKATETFESSSKDVDSITAQIANNKRKIEDLQSQISATTLESIRQEQVTRIQAISNAITSLEEEFAKISEEKAAKEAELLRSNKSVERARNDIVSRTQRELDDAVSAKNKLSARDNDLDAATKEKQDEVYRLELLNQRIEAEKRYNALQEKSAILQGSIKKMEEDGATEDALSDKRVELEKVNAELTESLEKVKSLGGFIAQREVREYTDAERKSYALEQIKAIDNDLITARAQKNVVAARIVKKDREIAEVDRWGLGAGIGKRALNQEKYNATSEFMNSDYVRSLIDIAREQTKNAIAEAVGKSELAETNALRDFNEKIANAMITDGLNPHSNEQTQAFLKTTRGKQYSDDYNTEITSIQNALNEGTRELWSAYDERVKQIRSQVSTEFKESLKVDGGVLSYISKIRDEFGEWVDEIVEVHVADALRERLTDAKKILQEEQTPIQANIDRLYADRKTAIEYGGVGDKEILSADIIEDQIRKETDLNKAKEKRAELQQKISDLEQAGVADSDDSIKQEKKKLAETEKQIAQLEMLVRNRQKLVELRWDESKADSYTSEEKELHFTDQIANYNQKIEASLARQEDLKKKIESASGEEQANLQYQLSKEEERVANWRKSIKGYEGRLKQIETTKSEIASTKTNEAPGGLIGAIKESFANFGEGSNDVLSSIAETVSKILEAITSGGIKISTNAKTTTTGGTKNVALEKKLARIRVLEAEKAASVNKPTWTSAMSEEERKASIATVNTYDKAAVNKWKNMGADELVAVMQDITRSMNGLNKESVTYLSKQRELGRVLNVYKTKSSVKDEATVTKKNGKSYINSKVLAEKDEALKQLGLYDKYEPITSDLAVRNIFATPKNNGLSKKKEEELSRLKQEIKELNATARDNSGLRDAIPDEAAQETDELTVKVERLKQKFEEAKKVGYLDKNDADLKAFENAADKNEALRYGDKVSAKISKNRRAYSGTTEMNAVARQRDNIDARGILDNDDLDSVKAYNKAYSDLIAKHKEFSTAGTLYDPENQKVIQKMALNVKALGKELESAQTRSEDLQQKVANSGLYNGKAIGDMSQIAQGADLYEQMRAKLEELGATNIKIDRIHQKATGTIRHNNTTVSDLEVAYDELTGSLARYHRQERESLTGVPAFLNGFQKKFNSIMQYLSMTMSIHRIISEVRRGIQYIREIDKALTELKKVTDETEETYDKFLQTAAKTGARLGSTISAVTEATATFAKLGYSMKQAAEMAEAAIVYKNVGDGIASTEDAANSIISTLKGFGLEASESMAIVDKFNEVGE